MRATGSDQGAEQSSGRYAFSYSETGSYGHAVGLLDGLGALPGVVVDLGCGYGAIAEPLEARGHTYVGTDVDRTALADLSARGLETHELDLTDVAQLADRLEGIVAGRPVAAFFALDVIEHLVVPEATLAALREAIDRVGRPPLVVSVPNVAHIDIAAKLLFGRFDYTETGLLDGTHVSFFTAARLRTDMHRCGLVELAAADVTLDPSDQRFPADHPALARRAPVAELTRSWRALADQYGSTVQFVRAYVAGEFRPTVTASNSVNSSTLTVVTRTQGRRAAMLRDALTCLAAQTVDYFQVMVTVHSDDAETTAAVQTLVSEFDPSFAHRVEVVTIPTGTGGRARPLNEALERLASDYVAFLDDDDLVTADWVETFMQHAGEGSVVRSVSAVRRIGRAPQEGAASHATLSGLIYPYAPAFDLPHHLWQNHTPICSVAFPRSLIEAVALRFDEALPVLEDWDFLLRAAQMAAVRDTGRLTSIYQMWSEGESSQTLHDLDLWSALARVLQERMNAAPLVLPPGSAMRIVDVHQETVDMRLARDQAQADATRDRERAERLEGEVHYLTHSYRQLAGKYESVIASRRWRLLEPLAAIAALRRRG